MILKKICIDIKLNSGIKLLNRKENEYYLIVVVFNILIF